mgnify:CR=1 FL=1
MKLWKVTCRGHVGPMGTSWGVAYVCADDPTFAYNKLRRSIDDQGIGSESDRELESIVLVASDLPGSPYPKFIL